MKKKDIKVSVCCLTYNHVNYIRQAIDSFLEQKTNFDFEIMIHDDCSTDGTIEILKEYEDKYPDIVNVIYEKENQYSKNIKVEKILFENCNGKYIALCEGDDYWIDKNKLQIQYDFMERNDNYSLICHDARLYYENLKKFKKRKKVYKKNCDCSVSDFILKNGIGGIFPTCSMFFKSKCVKKMPKFFDESSVGDLPLTLYLGTEGECYYLDKIMGVYRLNTPGSWTVKLSSLKGKEVEKMQEGFNKLMEKFNEYSNYKYDHEIKLYLLKNEFELVLYNEDYKKLKENKFIQLYKTVNLRGKIRYFLLRNCPKLFIFMKRVKHAIVR